jgi:hypothetical protein
MSGAIWAIFTDEFSICNSFSNSRWDCSFLGRGTIIADQVHISEHRGACMNLIRHRVFVSTGRRTAQQVESTSLPFCVVAVT